ncbi:amine dehydrogenase large subunit [Yersinia mollaretii]|uniref:amine dehydrogenase large subunit n=1 Tax=Yersinia mollaretii TaxID=33060 RepID=UPI000B18327F|nr:amine dehydrogenase large subunit [Yersinia mollaretii]MDN0112230.1 amine dehydrogenase large subunit [Yersinia mollaretii]
MFKVFLIKGHFMKRNIHPPYLFAILFPIILISPALAETPFKPERISVEKELRSGPSLFVIDQSWSGTSSITVLSADDLKTKGSISTGLIAQFLLSKNNKQLYTASVYPKRIVWGPVEAVVQQFDVKTLSLTKEMPTSPKMAQVSASINSFRLSANEKYAFVQNATPAASVNVIDITSGNTLLEIPTPGCWGIYPSADDNRFSALCGDGTVASYQIATDQKDYKVTKSDTIFDADKDPLFISSQRDGDTLIFTSFNGNMYLLNDKEIKVTLTDKFSYTKGIKSHWVPTGFEILAFNKPNNLMFITMSPNGKEGSHKYGAKEIWGIDMASRKVITRVKTVDTISLAVSQTQKPELFALSGGEGGSGGTVLKYIFIGPQFTGKVVGKAARLGTFNQFLMVDY